jgi:hypothetical protein
MGPVRFTARLADQDYHVDLSGLACPRLARGLARALSSIAGEEGTQRSPRTLAMTVLTA